MNHAHRIDKCECGFFIYNCACVGPKRVVIHAPCPHAIYVCRECSALSESQHNYEFKADVRRRPIKCSSCGSTDVFTADHKASEWRDLLRDAPSLP